jgi:hypothetical protein
VFTAATTVATSVLSPISWCGPRSSFDYVRCLAVDLFVVLLVIVETSQPGSESFNGYLEIWMQIHELLHTVTEPFESYAFTTAPALQFLNASISEVHGFSLGEGSLDNRLLFDHVALIGPYSG